MPRQLVAWGWRPKRIFIIFIFRVWILSFCGKESQYQVFLKNVWIFFRHSFCVHSLSRQVQDGVDLYIVLPILSTYVGHNSVSATQRYVRLTAEAYPDLIEKVSQTCSYIIPEVAEYETDWLRLLFDWFSFQISSGNRRTQSQYHNVLQRRFQPTPRILFRQ